MSKNGKIRIHPLTGLYNAVRFQGYDREDNPIADCAETALTASPTGAGSALKMVIDAMREAGYPNPDPPDGVETYEENGDTNTCQRTD